MGGAQRNQRKATQEQNRSKAAAKAIAAARGAKSDRRNIIIGVVAVLAVALVVAGGILYTSYQSDQQKLAVITANKAVAEYPAVLQDDGTIMAGNPNAKVTLDSYEDFICSACGQFEKIYGDQVTKALADGSIKVHYRLVNILDELSRPPGYSLLAANAALAAAKAGKFADFHASLYASEPQENSAAYTVDQLISLGQRLGITGDQFANEARNGAYNDKIVKYTQAATSDPKLQRTCTNGSPKLDFCTPSVLYNGSFVNLNDQQWLTKLISNAKS